MNNLSVGGGHIQLSNSRTISSNGANGGVTFDSTVYASADVSSLPKNYYGNIIGVFTYPA